MAEESSSHEVTMSVEDIISATTIFGLENRFGGDGETDTANENTNIDWGNYKSQDLHSPLHQKLAAAKEIPKVNNKENKETATSREAAWRSRRRPLPQSGTASVARKYEDLAEVRKEVAETHLRILKQFEDYHNRRMKEEQEENRIRKQQEEVLFNLEVEIKKNQLRKLKEN
ncbi:hypothetical protein RN001_000522 [Aquatica leii]|uniref:Uncharacterized protein n=1 Tax=Aquatica leii TaxID=1421715 RepID=A0AAN7SCA0_9COLE|nr:hypothetical protein RN001_000522 [Aquatica leii]